MRTSCRSVLRPELAPEARGSKSNAGFGHPKLLLRAPVTAEGRRKPWLGGSHQKTLPRQRPSKRVRDLINGWTNAVFWSLQRVTISKNAVWWRCPLTARLSAR